MASRPKSFYWYDLETSGLKSSWDRIIQFAGQRTDPDLNPIGEPLELLVKLPPQVLPDPHATLVTGLTPSKLEDSGLSEWEGLQQIYSEFIEPGTCIMGYNNIAFDDDFIRYALFRNLLPPYQWSWANGNSRFDLIRVVHTLAAFRPDAIKWEVNEDNETQYSLSDIAQANGFDASQAHDALADVKMSIEVAQLIKKANPRLWDYTLRMRDKRNVKNLVQSEAEILLHVNHFFGKSKSFTAPVSFLGFDPDDGNRVLVVDLNSNIDLVLEGTLKEIAEARYVSRRDVEENNAIRLELFSVRINQSPIFVETSGISDVQAERFKIDRDLVQHNQERIWAYDTDRLAERIDAIFSTEKENSRHKEPEDKDPSECLFDGFPPDSDVKQLTEIHKALQNDHSWPEMNLKDQRVIELERRFHYERRPEEVPEFEESHQEYIRKSLRRTDVGLESKQQILKELQQEDQSEANQAILNELADYYQTIAERLV